MHILILNWRDIGNPASGGAEILTHEIAKSLIKKGHKVSLISSYFINAKAQERLDGVEITRVGDPDVRRIFNSVHFKAYKLYRNKFQGKVDLVIDEVHGIPFFTPLYVKEKKIALICEMAGDLWSLVLSFPFNLLGKFVEKIYPYFYKNMKVITISESSRKELIKYGFPSSNVKILSMGSNSKVVSKIPKKEKNKTLIFISRLSPTKGVMDAINSIKILKKSHPDIKLWIVGRGEVSFIDELSILVKELDLTENIKFFGFISDSEKEKLLSKAHILIAPSVKEGWGLTIHEAGARATPAVVYNVAGLRDVVKNNVNGLVCTENTPQALAKSVSKILSDKKLYSKLQLGALSERKKHTWDNTADKFLEYAKK